MAGLWNGCPAKGVASGDAAARGGTRISTPTGRLWPQFTHPILIGFFWFSIQKNVRLFLFNTNQSPKRDMAGLWSGCAAKSAVAVREPWLRSYFGWLAQWLSWWSRAFGPCSQIWQSAWATDPCPSLLDGDTGMGQPPNKERGPCAWGAVLYKSAVNQMPLICRTNAGVENIPRLFDVALQTECAYFP
jgi:hypothetical protein